MGWETEWAPATVCYHDHSHNNTRESHSYFTQNVTFITNLFVFRHWKASKSLIKTGRFTAKASSCKNIYATVFHYWFMFAKLWKCWKCAQCSKFQIMDYKTMLSSNKMMPPSTGNVKCGTWSDREATIPWHPNFPDLTHCGQMLQPVFTVSNPIHAWTGNTASAFVIITPDILAGSWTLLLPLLDSIRWTCRSLNNTSWFC
jgi:hypothetical protein